MTRVPAVSCMVVAKNAAEFMPQALASIRAQTHEDFEVLLVIDESQDETEEIGRRAEKEDGRFRVVKGTGGGICCARETAFHEARAEWVAPLDADDLWEPERLQTQLEFVQKRDDLVIVSAWGRYIGRSGKVVGRHAIGPTSEEEWARWLAEFRPVGLLTSSVMCRRKPALTARGARRFLDPAEDSWLWTHCAQFGGVRTLPVPLARYRVHGTSESARSLVRQRRLVRWLEHVLRCRARGETALSAEEFENREEARGAWHQWNMRRQGRGAGLYRRAGGLLADGHWCRGALSLALSAVLYPGNFCGKFGPQVLRHWMSRAK